MIPVQDEFGFYEIRFESIGGLGAHLATQIIGNAVVLKMGLNASQFSSYGSEKKGSPLRSYIRICEPGRTLRTSSPVERPHLVAVFHETLIQSVPVMDGLRNGGILIINTVKPIEEMKKELNFTGGTLGVVDALGIAVEEKTRLNTAMMGAVVKASGFLDPDAIKSSLGETFGVKHPAVVQANLKTFDRGYNELKMQTYKAETTAELRPPTRIQPLYGYEDAPIGGAIKNIANTVLKDLSGSRTGFVPVWTEDKCIDCGICDLVCSDYCFVWEVVPDQNKPGEWKTKLRGIDYQYCKGCLKCIDVCITGALTKERETEDIVKTKKVPHFWEVEKK